MGFRRFYGIQITPFWIVQLADRHLSFHPPGADGIDGDAALCHFQCQRLRQADHAEFAGGVGAAECFTGPSGYARYVYDASPTALDHRCERRPGDEHSAGEIGLQNLVPALYIVVFDWIRNIYAGVIDYDVRVAESLFQPGESVFDVDFPGHVATYCNRRGAALVADLLGQVGERFLIP